MQATASSPQAQTMPRDEERIRPITDGDLPLSCPMPSDALWDAHPRVFLTLDAQGRAVCPYCGTTYIREDKQGQ